MCAQRTDKWGWQSSTLNLAGLDATLSAAAVRSFILIIREYSV